MAKVKQGLYRGEVGGERIVSSQLRINVGKASAITGSLKVHYEGLPVAIAGFTGKLRGTTLEAQSSRGNAANGQKPARVRVQGQVLGEFIEGVITGQISGADVVLPYRAQLNSTGYGLAPNEDAPGMFWERASSSGAPTADDAFEPVAADPTGAELVLDGQVGTVAPKTPFNPVLAGLGGAAALGVTALAYNQLKKR